MDGTATKSILYSIFGVSVRRGWAMRECRWIAVLLAVIIGAGLNASHAAAQSTCPAGFTQFTCPGTPDDVFVIDHPMCLEADCVFHRIRIEAGGELRVPDETQKADAKKINDLGQKNNRQGRRHFSGRTSNQQPPYAHLHGRPSCVVVVDRDGPNDPCPSEHFDKGIEVCGGGTLNLLGTKGVPALGGTSWTYLSAPAGDPAKYGPTDMQSGPCSGADQSCGARDATGCANDPDCNRRQRGLAAGRLDRHWHHQFQSIRDGIRPDQNDRWNDDHLQPAIEVLPFRKPGARHRSPPSPVRILPGERCRRPSATAPTRTTASTSAPKWGSSAAIS